MSLNPREADPSISVTGGFFFGRNSQADSKLYMEMQREDLPDFQTHYKAVVAKA